MDKLDKRMDKLDKREKYFIDTYGIGFDDINEFMEIQDSKCAICECNISINIPHEKPCVDYVLNTGEIRGLLCKSCHSGIELFNNDPIKLIKAAIYLCYELDNINIIPSNIKNDIINTFILDIKKYS